MTDQNQEKLYHDLLEERKDQIIELVAQPELLGRDGQRLRELLARLHNADLADLLETSSPEMRLPIYEHVSPALLPSVIHEMDESAAEAAVREIPPDLLTRGLRQSSETEDIEGVLRNLPPRQRTVVIEQAGLSANPALMHSLSFAPDTVGEILDFQQVSVPSTWAIGEVQEMLRRRRGLPSHCDKLFVCDDGNLVGILPIKRLLFVDVDAKVAAAMVKERLHVLDHEDSVDEAIALFERYDLISAPVLSGKRVVGRVTVDQVVARMHGGKHDELLSSSGLQDDEDLFAPILRRLKNRSLWIFVNLIAAFMISRVIGAFEHAIDQVVALAVLMPIIASMAGNTSMQTATLVIRGLALNQLQMQNWHVMLGREVLLGVVNGVIWGLLAGLFGLVVYQQLVLALILTVSMMIVFVLAAGVGFVVPIIVKQLRGDPALGTAVIVTTLTDGIGFMVFLGLASALLI